MFYVKCCLFVEPLVKSGSVWSRVLESIGQLAWNGGGGVTRRRWRLAVVVAWRDKKKFIRYWGTAIVFLFHLTLMEFGGNSCGGNLHTHLRRLNSLNEWTNWKLASYSNRDNVSLYAWLFGEDSMVQCEWNVCVFRGHRFFLRSAAVIIFIKMI